MRLIIRFLFCVFLFSNFSNLSIANEKTAFIDFDYIVQNSNVGKKVLANISNLNKKNISELEKKNKILINREKEIKNKKNVISENDFTNEVKLFQEQIKLFNNEKNKIVDEFNKYKKKEIDKIFELFNPIINDYMKNNSINILLDSKNVFVGNLNSDITQNILKIINNQIK